MDVLDIPTAVYRCHDADGRLLYVVGWRYRRPML